MENKSGSNPIAMTNEVIIILIQLFAMPTGKKWGTIYLTSHSQL